jgi:hypothetical protein
MRRVSDRTIDKVARANEYSGPVPPAPAGYIWQRGGECSVEQTTNWLYLIATRRTEFVLWLCSYRGRRYTGIFNVEGGYRLTRGDDDSFVTALLAKRRLGI